MGDGNACIDVSRDAQGRIEMNSGGKWWLVIAGWLASGLMGVQSGPSEEDLMKSKSHMIEHDLRGRGITNNAVLRAMEETPREVFVPVDIRDLTYGDHPLPIGHGQTISQPYMVAAMTELIHPEPHHVVFEVGTGSGYQAAVLSRLVSEVYTVEIVPALGEQATRLLAKAGAINVHVRVGDGYAGWPDHAPFDGIIVTCGAEEIPPPLIEQLKPGGTMVIPVGPFNNVQELIVVKKAVDGSISKKSMMPVRFVPMTGERTNFKGESQ